MTQKEIYKKQIAIRSDYQYVVDYDGNKIYGFFDLNDDESTKKDNIWNFIKFGKEITERTSVKIDGNKITKIVIEKRKI